MSFTDDLPGEVAERILSLKKPRESWRAFADRIGLTPQLVSNWKTGTNKPSLQTVATILVRMPKLSGSWLLTGAGVPEALPVDVRDLRLRVAGRVIGGEVDAILPDLDRHGSHLRVEPRDPRSEADDDEPKSKTQP